MEGGSLGRGQRRHEEIPHRRTVAVHGHSHVTSILAPSGNG